MSEFSIKKVTDLKKASEYGQVGVSDWQGQITVNSMRSLPVPYKDSKEKEVYIISSVDMLDSVFKYKVRKKALH